MTSIDITDENRRPLMTIDDDRRQMTIDKIDACVKFRQFSSIIVKTNLDASSLTRQVNRYISDANAFLTRFWCKRISDARANVMLT